MNAEQLLSDLYAKPEPDYDVDNCAVCWNCNYPIPLTDEPRAVCPACGLEMKMQLLKDELQSENDGTWVPFYDNIIIPFLIREGLRTRAEVDFINSLLHA